MSDFTGKMVMVTGGATGIGAASAAEFAARGAHVYILDVNDDDGRATTRRLEEAGGNVEYRHVDVTNEKEVRRALTEAVDDTGRFDVLHANAGIEWPKPIADTELADWRRVIDINLTGIYIPCRHALRYMLHFGRGAIVITSSPHAVATVPDAGAYAASKGGTLALTRALALEGATHGVRANAVLPGAIDTPMMRREAAVSTNPEEQARRFGLIHPMARLGQPAEIAVAVAFLASDAASFITGAALPVDGGLMASLPSGPPLTYSD